MKIALRTIVDFRKYTKCARGKAQRDTRLNGLVRKCSFYEMI